MPNSTHKILHKNMPKISQCGTQNTIVFCSNKTNISSIALWILDTNRRIFLLCGAVGSGKTTLIQEIITCMQMQSSSQTHTKPSANHLLQASSPTFGIRNEYGKVGKYGEVFHYDLYNVSLGEVLELGLLEWLSQQGWHFLEWGEEVLPILQDSGFECVKIDISEEDLEKNLAQDFIENVYDKNSTQANSKRFYKISL